MTTGLKLSILLFVIAATVMEVSGDAIIRKGLSHPSLSMKAGFYAVGAALLFGYGYALNSAPIAFEKVVGIYIATLFIVWQIGSYIAFRAVPGAPVLAGGALIVGGGLIVAFWPASHAGS